jgi:uncharacterized protein YlxW (UPF0749 family)
VMKLNNKRLTFSLITVVIGFMLAIQFQTTKEPVKRDTRDLWELREDLEKEQKLQSELILELRQVDKLLKEYSGSTEVSKLEALMQQKEDLKKKVGLTKRTGKGVVLTVEPMVGDFMLGQPLSSIPPLLISRLINELNRYHAEAIAIGDQRIIATTPIREVNNVTYVNNSPISPFPVKIFVIAKDVERLNNYLKVSPVIDDFALENFELTSTTKSKVTLPPYSEPLRIKYMEPVSNVEMKKG